ncbi:unnamed protein product [Rotaria sordida]|uniref:MULE transposase domain-containing protein n=1 Tax=Rotaria sordida TaxID=392033 RepID=A0A815WSH2_9BILA|nr:unnamed protein product [Rotaria sordida]CAF1273652.1 unnamed protein product [Rotaria sordida]CAF1287996.1 unnamed protein product [Rotaria sordida]CAF1365314.1 unnamed protein product [Rotaria sordida]CAF1553024.1 unnamed protein product [Rotaria sordida]
MYLCGSKSEHNHEPNPEMITVRQVRHNIKERALKEVIPIPMIYEQELSKASTNPTTLAILPTSEEIYPSVLKVRQKVIPLLPQSCFFDIPDEYKTTIDGQRFLLADESLIRRERLLMFSSDRQLDLLFQSPVVYMDGTFAKSPPHFKQIYIIHAVFIDICLPCVFCLLINKKAVTYRHIFDELKQIAVNRGKIFSPAMIMSDFESGIIPVVKSEFPTSKHSACFFHFCQAIYRQIQHLGMQKDYSTNESLRLLCRKIMALALMPREQVVNSFNEIQADADQLPDRPMADLLKYFEQNWLNDIDLWNVFASDIRTNNVCEAGATKRKNIRTTSTQRRIDVLYSRYANNLINVSNLLLGLSYVVAKKSK